MPNWTSVLNEFAFCFPFFSIYVIFLCLNNTIVSHGFKSIVEFFTNSPQYKNTNIAKFVLAAALDQWSLQPWNINLLYPLISNFIFTKMIRCKWRRKQQTHRNTKLTIMPILPTLCVCDKPDLKLLMVSLCCHIPIDSTFRFKTHLCWF